MALVDTPVLVLDCQATGASPKFGHVLEIGWTSMRDARDLDATIVASCVALPDGATIPPIVRELTGIGPDDVAAAPAPGELWSRLCTDASTIADDRGVALAVVHFARFEQAFLGDLHARERPDVPFPLEMLCTHEIARRVLPGMPRLGLRALAGYFGHGAEDPRRSHGHVWATAFVWRHLVDVLAQRGIEDLAALRSLLAGAAPKATRREYPMPKRKRLDLPDVPGVYRMLRTSGDVLYVGKATSLRKRVNGWFQKQSNISDRLLEMLSQARDLDVTPTASALEAAVLETDEIKRLAPPFNEALLARERAAWFVGDVLDDPRPIADRRRRLGPLGSQWHGKRLAALGRALSGEATVGQRDPIVAALGWPDPGEIEEATLVEGLARLRLEVGDALLDRRAAMRIGAKWWREQLAAGTPIEDIDDAEVAADVPWTPEDVHDELREVVITFARVVRRARWLRTLAESTVAFVDGAAARLLVLEGGVPTVARDHDPHVLPPPPRADAPPFARRGALFDVATFDRLRVLSTELRRIVGAGGHVAIRSGRARMLTADELGRLFAWL
jgi:DNA polymerase-3 subunit epsilon